MNYTRDHMEAACCLWEAMLELVRAKDFSTLPEGGAAVVAAFTRHGAAAMRNVAIDLAAECDEEWNELTEDARDDIGAFDWEFCPSVIKRVDWTQWPPVTPNGPLGGPR